MRQFLEDFPLNSGRSAFAPPFPDYVEEVVLLADTPTRLAIPAGARFAVFSFEGHVRVRLGTASATLDAVTATLDGSGAEWNPAARRIPSRLGDGVTRPTHILLRAPAATQGTVTFYA